MKYLRGYLTAAILVACTWAVRQFARTNTLIVDMIYPYISRMVQTFLVEKSSSVDFCLWQVLLVAAVALVLLSILLMIIFKWKPFRWLGWVCATVAALVFLHTCLYGLNEFSGSISEDVRLNVTAYNVAELEEAAIYYREQANGLSEQITRGEDGNVAFADFEAMALQAADGFHALAYEESLSVFSGSAAPVKKLSGAKLFSAWGIAGVTVGLTGEATVNPDAPAVMLPFVMCQQMAKRMSIVNPRDAAFGAFLACMHNSDPQFRYSGMLMSYRYCLMALEKLDTEACNRVLAGQTEGVTHDLQLCDRFLGDRPRQDADACDLLVSWYIERVVLPAQNAEQVKFNPLDKDQVGELT